MAYVDRDAERITARKWSDIRGEWKNYIPALPSPWPMPEEEVFTLDPVLAHLRTLKDRSKILTVEEDIQGLRQAVLHDAVSNLHKAGNILRASALEGESGYRSWCRSSAYHASVFAARGVLGALGVVLAREVSGGLDFQVDVCAPRSKKPRLTEPKFATRMIRRERPAEHKELWGIFTRVLRIAQVDASIWPPAQVDTIKRLEPGAFAMVRHRIHYRSAGWPLPDVDSQDVRDAFAGLAEELRRMTALASVDHEDFPCSMALCAYSMGVALIQDLGVDVPEVKSEAERMAKWMSGSPWLCCNAFEASGG